METIHSLEISSVRSEPNDTLVVEFQVPEAQQEAFKFHQGQYLTLVADIAGEEIRRSYSICTAVGEALTVAIKKIPSGKFSCYAHEHFDIGTKVRVLAPDGQFFSALEPEKSKKYLCIAAGTGITPILSVVKTVLLEEPKSQVTLIYGNRASNSILFKDELLWLKNQHMDRLHWINIFSREAQPSPILNGRIDNKKGAELNRCLIDIEGFDEAFLCGPEGMISEVSRGLRQIGLSEDQIHYELFFASAEDARIAIEKHQARARTFADLTTVVRVTRGGREVSFQLSADGESILDGALAAGMDLPYSCKGGVCATCKAKVLEGEVDLDLNHGLTQAEIEQGFVLTCQAHPISKNVSVDFDVI